GPAGAGPETRVTLPVPATNGVPAVSPLTAASPELVTVSAAENVSPRGRLRGMTSWALSAEGVCTIAGAEVTGDADTALPSPASVPCAPALNVPLPAAVR